MTNDLHPRVFYRWPTQEIGLAYGYLSIIDGVPWLAATQQEAESRIAATMLQLDPQLLSEQQDSDSGEKTFLYHGALGAR